MNDLGMIDAEVHIWDWHSLKNREWLAGRSELERSFMPADLYECLSACGVEQGILIEAEKSSYSLGIWWLEITEYCPYLKTSLIGCDLERDNLPIWLEAFSLWPGFKGVRAELRVTPEGWMQNPGLLRALRLLQKERVALEVETTAEGLCGLSALAEHHPDLVFIINDSACPPAPGEDFASWMREVETLARHTNVVVKTSDVSLGDDDALRKTIVGFLVDVFGAHRVMWGSGWPVLRPGVDYAHAFETMQAATVDLSASDRDSIFGGSARRIYRL